MGKIELNNGVKMPDICFGTGITYLRNIGFKGSLNKTKCQLKVILGRDKKNSSINLNLPKMIKLSMEMGCNCFDTSAAYGASEFTLAQTLKSYPRESYFIVTKLGNNDQYTNNVRGGLERSLSEMGLDYVDLYLMHWPVEDYFIESWKQMEQLYKEGKCRAIGVCNFNIHHLEELKKHCSIIPTVNQIECHPLFTQDELRDYCNKEGIHILAYTATARMDERLNKTCLTTIAKKYNKSIAQIMLRWHQQIGNIPIFTSSNKDHLINNLEIDDFKLEEDEIQAILNININSRLRYDPDNCDFRQL